MYTVNFFIGSVYKTKKGETPIRVSISANGFRFQTTIGIRISFRNWNQRKHEVRSNTNFSQSINRRLSVIKNFFGNRMDFNDIHSKDDIKRIYNTEFGSIIKKELALYSVTDGFFNRLNEFITENSQNKRKPWTLSTVGKFEFLKKRLKRFNPCLTFDYFTARGFDKYVDFLVNETAPMPLKFRKYNNQLKIKHLSTSTIKKQIGYLKWFLKWAEAKGYNHTFEYKIYKPNLLEIKGDYRDLALPALSKAQCDEIEKTTFPPDQKNMYNVSRQLIFICNTGLRYSDLFNLKWSNVCDLDKAKPYILYTSEKTYTTTKVYLNQHSKPIIFERVSIPHKKDDYVFDVNSNPATNRILKQIGKICHIDMVVTIPLIDQGKRYDMETRAFELLTVHTGRRTFATRLHEENVSTNVISEVMGHSNVIMTDKYIRTTDSEKNNATELLND